MGALLNTYGYVPLYAAVTQLPDATFAATQPGGKASPTVTLLALLSYTLRLNTRLPGQKRGCLHQSKSWAFARTLQARTLRANRATPWASLRPSRGRHPVPGQLSLGGAQGHADHPCTVVTRPCAMRKLPHPQPTSRILGSAALRQAELAADQLGALLPARLPRSRCGGAKRAQEYVMLEPSTMA